MLENMKPWQIKLEAKITDASRTKRQITKKTLPINRCLTEHHKNFDTSELPGSNILITLHRTTFLIKLCGGRGDEHVESNETTKKTYLSYDDI